MVTYGRSVHPPTLLMQGEDDTLFNINEAVANHKLLAGNHAPVKLVLQSWGHSQSTPAPGEIDYTDAAKGYEVQLMDDWFAKYLQHRAVSTGPAVEYYRDWAKTPAGGSAEAAYGTATAWPVGTTEALHLTGNGALTAQAGKVTSGTRSFVNPPGGLGGSYSETSAVENVIPGLSAGPRRHRRRLPGQPVARRVVGDHRPVASRHPPPAGGVSGRRDAWSSVHPGPLIFSTFQLPGQPWPAAWGRLVR